MILQQTRHRFPALIAFFFLFAYCSSVFASGESDNAKKEYKPFEVVVEHIADANEIHIWEGVHMPLPCILYAPDEGWTFTMSSTFEHGTKAIDRYVLIHGRVHRIKDDAFPMGEVKYADYAEHGEASAAAGHSDESGHSGDDPGDSDKSSNANAEKEKAAPAYITYEGKQYEVERPSKLDGNLLGYGITSFYDFSVTKNVFTMILAGLLLVFIFFSVASGYKKNKGKAPSGIQSLMEPIFLFMRDEVTRPMIGEKHYERFQPFIMSLFFFILFCNLFGLIPFFPGGANVTGNIAVTLTLAVITFIVTNINGNAHYWQHILWMPGIPTYVKFILTPVEILSLFIKPFSLMIRLFANISAGHIIILSLVGLVFLFGDMGQNPLGAGVGAIVGGLFTAFMNLIELLVAFVQAFIFAILSASYIGAAVEEGHHDEAHAH